jgi:hypothetical protein
MERVRYFKMIHFQTSEISKSKNANLKINKSNQEKIKILSKGYENFVKIYQKCPLKKR